MRRDDLADGSSHIQKYFVRLWLRHGITGPIWQCYGPGLSTLRGRSDLALLSIPGRDGAFRRQPAPLDVFLPLGWRLSAIVFLNRRILLGLQPSRNRLRAHGASAQVRMLANIAVNR